ncbi:MAG: tetratricopeptide repeat protein [Armatimonadota bacterium]
MPSRRSARRWLALLLVVPAAIPAAAGEPPGDAKSPPVPVLKRPDWGRVIGWVLDAETRRPIPEARIAVEIDGAFPETGKSTDRTDRTGRFEARAPLGKISTKFDWGRLLTMHPISLLLSPRSVTKQTRIVEVAQVNVRVEATGYQPFVGRVRATRTDPERFSITLDDVWLAREGGRGVSFSPTNRRLEVVEGLAVEPAIAAPGEKVRITLTTQLPVDRGYKYRAYATSTAIRVVDEELELKREKGPKDETRVVFSREVTLPKTSQDTWTELSFFLIRDERSLLRQRDTRVLLQIVRVPAERAAAEKVAEGFAAVRVGDRDEALRLYGEARRLRPDYELAHLLYGDLCLQLNRPKDAAASFRRLVELSPRDYEIGRTRYAHALIESGDPKQAMEALAGAEQVTGKNRLPAMVALCRARVFAAHGNFAETDRWLALAGAGMRIPDEIQQEINLRRMETQVRQDPKNADLRLSYARVLSDARRHGEAVAQIREAARLDPGQPWAFLDLGLELRALNRHPEALANLRHALKLAPENVEALIALGDALRDRGEFAEALPLYRQAAAAQPLNLRARHNYALMLYAAGSLGEARTELVEVLAQARDKGDMEESGLPIPGSGIYFGPKRRLVSGFSIPEAAADLAILEALQELEARPESGLLWHNIGSALLDLGLPRLALPALERAAADAGVRLETRYLLGVAYRRLGRDDRALSELKSVVAINPLHPSARLELAQLYTDRGDLDAAQAQLLEHERNYPYQRPPEPTRSFGS